MIVDAKGEQITAREDVRLLSVSTTRTEGGWLVRGPHAADLIVAEQPAEPVRVTIWGRPLEASTCSPEADEWFAKLLDQDVRLVCLIGGPMFADAYPLLLTTSTSLRQLNDWVAQTAIDRDEPTPDPLVMQAVSDRAWSSTATGLSRRTAGDACGSVRSRSAPPSSATAA